MKQTWTDQNKQEFTVAELFKHNQILIDLEYQPDDIKAAIESVITAEHCRERTFSYFHMLRFIGKYKLTKLAENIDNFIPLLSK
jgi:hypothetical protein